MSNIDIVLQGPIHKFTNKIIDHYSSLGFVNKIIVSCWDTDKIDIKPSNKTVVVRSIFSDVKKRGSGNINLQLQTTKSGLEISESDIVAKIRTDQQFHLDDMFKMKDTFEKNYNTGIIDLNGINPRGKIFVGSFFIDYPYHPRDHILWGFKEDMYNMFNIPFSAQDNLYPNFNEAIRAETYLGVNYYSRFSEEAKTHCLEYKDYLLDSSPKRDEAKSNDLVLRNKLFGFLPRVRLIWEKYNMRTYRLMESPGFNEIWS